MYTGTTQPQHMIWQQESGQIVMDKSRSGVKRALYTVLQWNLQAQTFYPLMPLPFNGGDKDTFQTAFAVEHVPYSMNPYWLATVGRTVRDDGYMYGRTMVQHDFEGNVLFLHRNGRKFQGVPTEQEIKREWSFLAESAAAVDSTYSGFDIKIGNAGVRIRDPVTVTNVSTHQNFGLLEQHCLRLLDQVRGLSWHKRWMAELPPAQRKREDAFH